MAKKALCINSHVDTEGRVFLYLMGSHFLKEKHQGIRLAGASIIFAGGFLISLAR